MAFQSNVPLAADKLSTSQSDINGNFTEINTFVAVDHEEFNIADQGKHKSATFTLQGADKSTAATELAIYAKAGTGGTTSLFLRKPSDGTSAEFSYAVKANPGCTILPSGIIMQWGSGNIAENGTSVNIPLAMSFGTYLSCQATTLTLPAGAIEDSIVTATDGGISAGVSHVYVQRKSAWKGAITVNVFAIGY